MSREFKKGELLSLMISLATRLHEGQFDFQGMPYILHPLKVMHYLKTTDEELMCIAVGHDLLEDTTVTVKELQEQFTQRIASAIHLLSRPKFLSYDEYIEHNVCSSVDALKVKLADLRHNSDIRRLKGIGPKDAERLDRYAKAYIKIKSKLSEIYPNIF